MADNFEANSGSGGSTFSADDIGGVLFPRSKLVHGADGTNDGDVSKANPLPVGTNTVKDGTGTNQAFLADSDGHLQVDVLTNGLPAGASTAAKQPALGTAGTASSDVLTVQGIAAMTPLLATLSGTNNIATVTTVSAVTAISNALPAGTNNIGDVDVLTVPTDPFGANADAASATGSISAKLRFIASTGIPVTGTVTVGSHAVTNAGTFVVQENGGALTALQLIDDCIYVDDADWTDSTSKHALVGGLYQSTPQTITDGDVGPLQVTENGVLKVAIISGAGSGGTASADDADFSAGTTSGTPAMGVYESAPSSVTDGDMGIVGITQTRALRTAVEGTVTVASHAVTNAGTFAVQVDGTALTRLTDIETNTDFGAVVGGGTEATALRVTIANNSTGVLSVDDNGAALTVDNGGTFAVQVDGNALTSLQLIDDAIVADDAAFTPATTKVMMAGFEFDDSTPDSVNEGDAGAGRMSANRCQYVNIRDNAGNERGLNIDASGQLAVTLASAQTLATVTTVSTVTTCSTVTTVSTLTGSGIAHDAADSGNPHKIGMKATAAMTARTLVAADDRTDLFAGLDGVAITRPHAPLEDQLQDVKTNTDGASTAMTGGFAAPGANIRLYLTTLSIANTSASNITVDIRDGSGGSVIFTAMVPATGGFVHAFAVPLKFTANTAAAFDGSAAATTLTVSMVGFKSKAG